MSGSAWLNGGATEEVAPGSEQPDRELALDLYRKLTLIRTFERATAAAYGRGQIHGTHRSSLGQEAVPIGVCHALRTDDVVATGLRSVGDILARGGEPRRLMAELFGKATGLCGGRGGALHLTDAAHGVVGGTAVMTANAPVAVGLAIAARNAGRGAVVVCFLGDRATNQGVFHESMNAAALQNLPIAFVGINNAPEDAATSLAEHTAAESMAALAATHGIRSEIVDGSDVVGVYQSAAAVVDRLRGGEGPAFLECRCYPLGEPSRAQVEAWMEAMRRSGRFEGLLTVKKREIGKTELAPPPHWLEADPVRRLERRIGEGEAERAELAALRASAESIVQDALEFAERSPEPAPDTAQLNVFATPELGVR
jgi:TPP-dependent pyruvate/acetoin dehydrogenase alpha subunit